MDITESFRTEDISKTDFFDFVIAPDNNQSFQSFTKQMRAVNVYLEDDNGDPKTEPNNNTLIIDQDHHTLNSTTLDVTNSTLNSSSISTSYDPLFWNCDKETVRLETAILEDLNKYCWSQDTTDTIVTNNINNANSGSSCDTANNNNNPKLLNNNTDGHIYTLTVLNGVEQTHWYRPPTTLLSHQSIVKDDHDGSLPAPSPMEHIPQPQLDIDSILNIIPNGYNNNYDQQTLSPHNTVQLTTDGLIKSETFTYDDSGYADTKDGITNALMIDTPMLEAHDNFNNNNNNDWKTDNNNTNNDNNNNNSNSNNNNTNSNNTSGNTAESLLRSALQGKTFLRYQKKTLPHSESHSELRRALSTPPSKTEELPPSATANDHQMMTLQLSNNNIILFDNSNQMTHHPESSTQSMDDLLLSQLDATSYPVEDYEKLKHIANEVVESVQQYCQLDRVAIVGANNIYVNASDLQSLGAGSNTEIIAPVTTTSGATIIQTTNINPSPPTTNLSTITTAVVTSSKPTTKKYKRTNSNSSTKQNTNNNNNNNNMQTNIQTATSTSNGVRKERSLHYCSICSKGFKDKYSVNVHIRTHTGEKPFACSLCGKSFRQKAHLAKHYQTHIAQKNAAANATNSTTGSNKKNTPAIVTNNNNNNNSTTNNKNNNSDTTSNSNNNNNNINNNNNSTIIVQSVTTPISINSISTSASVTCTPMTPTTNVITTSR